MDNSMATRPYSPLKGDPYRAYEALPAEVRQALQEALVDWCPLRARAWHLDLLHRARLRPAQAAHVLVQTIRRQDQAEVAAFARRWAKGASAYPHLAAAATLQRYAGPEGMPAAEPIVMPPPAPPSKAHTKPKAARTGKAATTAKALPNPKAAPKAKAAAQARPLRKMKAATKPPRKAKSRRPAGRRPRR